MPQPPISDAELERAIRDLEDPGQFRDAERLVARAAPSLQRVLNAVVADSEWFGEAHAEQIAAASSIADDSQRVTAVKTLVADETRVGMFIGVAVGWELARRLGSDAGRETENHEQDHERHEEDS